MIHRRSLAAALFSLLAASRIAAEGPADLDSVVARAMKVFEVPGIGLAIVQNDALVLAKG